MVYTNILTFLNILVMISKNTYILMTNISIKQYATIVILRIQKL